MQIDRRKFFVGMIAAFGALKQAQVDGTNALLDAWEKIGTEDTRWLAYVLATAWHETASTMQPIEEYGHGHGRPYGVPDPETGKVYDGRGLVQLTWRHNYRLAGQKVGADLERHPELALQPDIAAKVAITGMIEGWFTGKRLGVYFNNVVTDWVNARRIINGTDRAELIAGYALKFNAALKDSASAKAIAAATAPAAPATSKPVAPVLPRQPDDPGPKPAAPSGNWLINLLKIIFG